MYLGEEGARTYYEQAGEGSTALVFIHGWLGSGAVWREQMSDLSTEHTVVAYDLLGFGQSDQPDIEYTLEGYIQQLDEVIDGLSLENPVLVGWSMGATIALAYTSQNPDKVSKLVLVDGTPQLVADENFTPAVPPDAAEQLLGGIGAAFPEAARGFVNMMVPEEGQDELRDELFDISQQTTSTIALNSIGHVGSPSYLDVPATITVPTLVLCGTEDHVCPQGASDYFHEHIPNSEITKFEGKGHCPFLTAADTFNERLVAFVHA